MDVVLATAGYDNCVKFWNVVDGSVNFSIQHNESVPIVLSLVLMSTN